jgi:cyanophycin synthetase
MSHEKSVMNSAGRSTVLQTGKVLYLGTPISLLSDKVFTGCNTFHKSTVFCQSVNFGVLTDARSEIAGADFVQLFLDRFLGLKSFVPQNGLKDEFIADLRTSQGVDFQTILLEAILAVETSIAFAMHDLNPVSYAAIEQHKNSSDLIWSCSTPKLSRGAAKVGLLGLIELLPETYHSHQTNDTQGFDAAFNQLWQQARRRRLAPSTSVIKLAAKKRGIPCETLGRQHLLLGHGNLQQQIYASMSSATSITAQKICADKRQTNRRLKELRLPVARQIKVSSIKAAHAAAEKIGFPLVIKPVKGKKGNGVTAGLTSAESINNAFVRAHKAGSDVLVESFITGDDFRLLVIGGKFVAAVNRQPPRITGDGKSTVAMLLDRLNEQPYRDGFRGFPVEKGTEFYRLLEQAGLTMSDIPVEGQTVTLRSAANVSTGGIAIDVTEQVHADNREIAERAAIGVGLDIAGIDFLTTDISRSYREVGGAILEINARPGLDLHIWPMIGKSRNVAEELLKRSFPPTEDGRIPVVAVSGDRGTGSTARTLDMILRGADCCVALTLQAQAYVNGASAELTQTQQTKAPLIMLRDPHIDTLVSTLSLRQTAKRGMLLEKCTLSVIMDRTMEGSSRLFQQGTKIVGRATTDCFVVSGTEVLTTFPFGIASFDNGKKTKRRLKNALMFAIAAAYGLGLSGEEILTALTHAPAIVPEAN